jgi:hypothetical protein
MTRDEALGLLTAHAVRLSEHFDSVQLLASYLEPDGTTTAVAAGQGNWWARLGMTQGFLEKNKAEGIADEITRRADNEE